MLIIARMSGKFLGVDSGYQWESLLESTRRYVNWVDEEPFIWNIVINAMLFLR
jgi:hypothetical protein